MGGLEIAPPSGARVKGTDPSDPPWKMLSNIPEIPLIPLKYLWYLCAKCSVGSTDYVCNFLLKTIGLCGRYCCLKLPRVTITYYDYVLRLRITISYYDYVLRLRITITYYGFVLRLRITITYYDYVLRLRITISYYDYVLRLRITIRMFASFDAPVCPVGSDCRSAGLDLQTEWWTRAWVGSGSAT